MVPIHLRWVRLSLLVCSAICLDVHSTNAQESDEATQRHAWFAQHQEMAEGSPHNGHAWQFVGPVRMSGRGTDVEAHQSQPDVLYVATASGGVWKSDDDGKSWHAIFETYATASIGDLAIAPSDPEQVWVGTGEANILRSSMAGTGIYKSVDGGQTFDHMGLTDTQHISRIVIHPKNPDVLYVAASGHEYTTNEQRGVYKSIDGGETWEHVFYRDPETAAIDLVMDPKHPDTLYLGTAPRLRRRWNDPIGGPQSGVHKTIDGGRTWTRLSEGLPDFSSGEYERVGIDVCASQPETVYVLLNHSGGGRGETGAEIFRSDDGGASFHMIEGNDKVRGTHPGYGWFFGQIRVDPNDPETVYCLGLWAAVSRDGGYTWTRLRGTHVDYHGAWINPEDSDHVLMVNDGGIMISHDGFASHERPNLPICHAYNCGIAQSEDRFHIYLSAQDTGAWRGVVDVSESRDAIPLAEWDRATGDEAGRHAVDPTNADIVYSVSRYGGGPQRTDYSKQSDRQGGRRRGGGGRDNIAIDWEGERKRAQWVSPIVLSPHDPQRIFYGAQYVFRTNDSGKNWDKISPDLTNFHPDRQGNIPHAVIFAISESPVEKGVIYAGSDDGRIHVTRDDGANWTPIDEGIPEGRCVASLEACHFEKGTVYAAINGKRHDDFECYLFRSTDYGATWERISANIPGSCANVLRQDPDQPSILYAGTDRAVYVTTDGAQTWHVLGADLPTVYVHDLAIQTAEDYCVIATHGRGCFVLDIRDIRTAVREPKP